VQIAVDVGAPIGKRPVGRQRKNRMKECFEGGSGKKPETKCKNKIFIVHTKRGSYLI
jgi:hypothetical protein